MQRRPYAPGTALAAALLAAGLAAGLAGCTDGSDGGGTDDAKPGDPAATAPEAEPGKYRTLEEPCSSVERGTLRALLPGLDSLADAERDKAYEGEAALTYDTDRRVGCRWQAQSPDGTRHLNIDFERVVSYDPAVSDDDRAQVLYDKKATAADIPAVAPEVDESEGSPESDASEESGEGEKSDTGQESTETGGSGTSKGDEDGDAQSPGSATASASESAANKADKSEKDNKNGDKAPGGSPSGGSPSPGDASADPATAPRPLDDLADVAYLDDRLVKAGSGVHRDVTLVFRASNVIVTVEYDHWSSVPSAVPESPDLQNKALRLAEELVGRFDE
ncbi:hypothetical protein [Streptomyces sp. NPDC048639]|uniref:hypothetical protein n=1 Tax=Streptomyces sp. NPDC048639 TaxID=3365581 RepID=UPI0037102B06